MPKTSRVLAVAVGAAALVTLTAGPAAGAVGSTPPQNNGQQQGSMPPQQQQRPKISDKKLHQFKTAYHKVQDIGQRYSPKIQHAGSREKAQEIQQQAQEKMVKAVEKSGLTVQEYSQITGLMQQDPSLMRRVFQR